MKRHRLQPALLILAAVLSLTDRQAAGNDIEWKGPVFDLFHLDDTGQQPQLPNSLRWYTLRHWALLEVDGAKVQARDWLHTAGFSLLDQRDSEGRHSYEVTSGNLATDGPIVQLHARFGSPQLSAGLHPRSEIPALGLTIPGETCAFELEGMRDRRIGSALMARLRWHTPGGRTEWGLAVPFAVSTQSIGVLLQLRVKIDQ